MTDALTLRRYAREMRKSSTEFERMAWSYLRRKGVGGLKFRRQAVIGRYIADFACFNPMVILELDGSQHAGSAYDAERDAWFRSQGFKVVRVWNNEVATNMDGVAQAILAVLGRR